jgi:hypothetical protein
LRHGRERIVRPVKVAVISALAALAIPASALAATDRIQSPGQFFAGGGGPGGEFRLDAGTRAQLDNTDPTAEHNVVAAADGPDGRELFQSDLIGQGTTEVIGTEYLTPGPYPFLCTIHDGMTGTLLVEGAGALPRPSVSVKVASSRLKKVRKGKLKVSVRAATASSDVSLIARVGKRTLPTIDGIDVGAGQTRALTLKLGRSVTKPLEDADKAKVTLSASAPFGAPARAKRTLR